MEISRTARIPAHDGAIYTIHKAENKAVFFTGGGDGTVIQWTSNDLTQAHVVARVKDPIICLYYLDKVDHLIIGTLTGGIHLLDLKEKKELRYFTVHTQGVFDFLRINNYLFVAGGDGMLSIWDTTTWSMLSNQRRSEKSIRSIAADPSGRFLALGCSDHSIRILNGTTMQEIKRIEQHTNSVFKVVFSPDGTRLLSGSRDAHLASFDIERDFELLNYIPAHNFTINHIGFSPDGQWLATASRDKSVKIWQASDLRFNKKLDVLNGGHVNSVNAVVWNEDSLFSCSDDRSLIRWQWLKTQ
jgi:WD40 repeat protein